MGQGRKKDIEAFLSTLSTDQRAYVFNVLREKIVIHPLEQKLNAKAEIILEAIDRASALTLRGIRGIIAEAAFKYNVIDKLPSGWVDLSNAGNESYDYLIQDKKGKICIQVKMQRLKNHKPMMACEGYRYLSPNKYVVETQKTRGGKHPKTGEDTRPYRFGEFDILAVSLQPSTNDWSKFIFTVANWLLPNPDNKKQLLKFQPVSAEESDDWTLSLNKAVEWLRSGRKKTIKE